MSHYGTDGQSGHLGWTIYVSSRSGSFAQKAVAVLLTLLALGVQGITIGPNPPAFVSPNVFKVLQEKFDLRLTGASAEADLSRALAS